MQMNHEDLAKRIDSRLDKIEEKLDKHLEVATVNKADLKWVQGYIRVSVSTLIALCVGVATTIFKVFFKV